VDTRRLDSAVRVEARPRRAILRVTSLHQAEDRQSRLRCRR